MLLMKMKKRSEGAEQNNRICGNCRWIEFNEGCGKCNNPDGNFCGRTVRSDYTACTAYEFREQNDCNDDIITDVVIASDHDEPETIKISKDVEQISTNISVGRIEIEHDNGRNVIHAIINAVSVRVNMPQGTVKALMACFAVLLIAVLLFAESEMHSQKTDGAEGYTVSESIEPTEQKGSEEAAETESETNGLQARDADGVLALKDYVNISPHYYYHLPDNVKDVWYPDEVYAENETLCDFTYDGSLYTVRSYVLDYRDDDLADIVKGDLSLFDDMVFIDEEYIDGKYGEILKIRFKTKDNDGGTVVGTGYYWYESSPKICCLEVTSNTWHDGKAEEMIKDSVYRVSAGTTAPYTIDEDTWDDIQAEEAMNSLAEDAMRDYYYESEPDSYPW